MMVARAVGVGGRGVGQRAGRRRPPVPAVNRAVLVVAGDDEASSVWPDSLAGPALMAVAQPVDGLGAGVLVDRLVGPVGEARRVVDRGDGDREGLGALVSTPPLAVPPLSVMRDGDRGRAVGVGGRGVGQRAGRRSTGGLAARTGRVVVVGDDEGRASGRTRWPGPALMPVAQPATVWRRRPR